MRKPRRALWRRAVPRRCSGPPEVDRRPRRRAVTAGFITLATLAASVVLVAAPAGTAQAAPLRSTPLITNNMQGADSGSDTKWTTSIARYIRSAEIVAVQEAGPVPPGEFVNNSAYFAGLPAIGRANYIQHHRWRFGREAYEVYFLQTDPNGGSYVGNRNNVALVTQREADEITAIPNPIQGGRAAIGVRFDNDWYFSFHAMSGDQTTGGRDAQAMLGDIDAFVRQQPGNQQWTVLGDFNREPSELAHPVGSRIYNSGEPTHMSGRELDYAVSSVDIPGHPVDRQAGATPDHFAVAVGALRAPTEPRPLFSDSRYIEAMTTGTVLAPTGTPTGSGEWLGLRSREPENVSQRFDIEFDDEAGFLIREDSGNRCAMVRPALLGLQALSLQNCSDDNSLQRFEFVSLGNNQYQIRNAATEQCLHHESPQEISWMRPCVDIDAQHWTVPQTISDLNQPDYETRDLPVAYTGSEGLQNLYTGQMLTSEPRGIPTTRVRAEPRTTALPNGADWSLEWVGEYLRLRDTDTDQCVELGDAPPGSDAPAGVDLKPCAESSAQRWEVDPYYGAAFRLQSRLAGVPGGACLALDPDDEGGDLFDIVQATECATGHGSQVWSFAPYSTATDQHSPTS